LFSVVDVDWSAVSYFPLELDQRKINPWEWNQFGDFLCAIDPALFAYLFVTRIKEN